MEGLLKRQFYSGLGGTIRRCDVNCRNLSYKKNSKKTIERSPEEKKATSYIRNCWLKQHINDKYTKQSVIYNYRCRSAFKLLQIDKRHQLIQPGMAIVDLGSSPGSWLQVITRKLYLKDDERNSKNIIIGVDKALYSNIIHTTSVTGDFTLPETQEKILCLLGDRKLDLVLSDMAPNACGEASTDSDILIAMAYSVSKFALSYSAHGANLLIKVWEGSRRAKLCHDLSKYYESVKIVKPEASRTHSAEIYILAKKFIPQDFLPQRQLFSQSQKLLDSKIETLIRSKDNT